jgi:hypothetical protein
MGMRPLAEDRSDRVVEAAYREVSTAIHTMPDLRRLTDSMTSTGRPLPGASH